MRGSGSNPLSNVSDKELIRELLRRNGKSQAAAKTERYGVHWEILVPLGKDNICHITMSDDDLRALLEG